MINFPGKTNHWIQILEKLPHPVLSSHSIQTCNFGGRRGIKGQGSGEES